VLARSPFHLNMNAVYDVEEVLDNSHLLEQLLLSPLAILQQATHVTNLNLVVPRLLTYSTSALQFRLARVCRRKLDTVFILFAVCGPR
jgi:hypothetical protein